MKKFVGFLFIALFAFILPVFSQVIPSEVVEDQFVLNLGTFAGIVGVISMLVTQVTKIVPVINSKRLYKILVSVLAGIIICLVAWILKISQPLLGLSFIQVVLYGLSAGLSGCGFYDIIKAIGDSFANPIKK